eukprot:scaffold412102_cov17-Prasinocladus_malaysianus.AAC.1
MTYNWVVTGASSGATAPDLNDPAVVTTSRASLVLVLAPSSLQAGQTYSFILVVTNAGGQTFQQSVNIK